MKDINLNTIRNIHMVGIKGVGMTALAKILIARGFTVTGSDVPEKFFTDKVLTEMGIGVEELFRAENLGHAELVVHSAAYSESNPEIAAALNRAIPVLTYPEMLGKLMQGKYGIAVTGTHGKTTTTALVGLVLAAGKLDPTVVVGSEVAEFGGNARVGASEYFVLEACEYRAHFLNYFPKVIILTNIEMDHPDYYSSISDVKRAFKHFISQLPEDGLLIACTDSQPVRELIDKVPCKVITYGFSVRSGENHYQLVSARSRQDEGSEFLVRVPNSNQLQRFNLSVNGRHNVLNATAALALADYLGLDRHYAKEVFETFKGAKRRFEIKGERNGVTVIDDYAHHPTEIAATLAGARERYPEKRLVAVFQPHTFSRTLNLFTEFAQAFTGADMVIITDIFSSAREQDGGEVSSGLLTEEIKKYHPKVYYRPTLEQVYDYLVPQLRSGDVLLTMGAGDVYKIGDNYLNGSWRA